MLISRDQIKKAQKVLESLMQGIDPENGGELPKEDSVNRIEVNRSMSIALMVLKEVDARIVRRSLLPGSVGAPWAEEEEQQLRAEFANSQSISEIATKHSRTIRAIEARLERLGLLRPDQRMTNDSFMSTPQRDK